MLWFALFACATERVPPPAAPSSAPAAAPSSAPAAGPVAAPVAAAAFDEACRARVEGPDRPGECAADADCAPTGCSSEVCAAKSEPLTTMCEVEACFAALDRCGCSGGVCRWTVRK
jgi:eight-cysteine-cluster-containing protein